MKIKISRNIRKYLIIYLALLLALYLVIEIVPKMTDIFETTRILEPGSLQLTNETDGYLIKTEYIIISPESGNITYLQEPGTAVRKHQKVVQFTGPAQDAAQQAAQGAAQEAGTSEGSHKYADLMDQLKGYPGVVETKKTPASGIFSLSMDGAEKALHPSHMDSLTREQVKDLPLHEKSLETGSVIAGDPIYKITNDNKWYVVCWLDEDIARNYLEGQEVELELPGGTVKATVRSITKEEDRYKVIFRSDVYYSTLASDREVEMTIRSSNRSGLLIENDCIIEKNGQQGVYVRNKNGDYYFARVNVIETDGKDSVISETSFIDPETGETVYTVSVYDEVLKKPKKLLKRDLKEEEKKKATETATKATKQTKATEATKATKQTKATDAAKATEATKATEQTKVTKATKPTAAEETKPSGEATQPAEQ